MFIVKLRNGNFALMKSNMHCNATMVCECESYNAAMEMKKEFELEE